MNAEDCALHRPLIDRAEAGGIFYPWVCECDNPTHYCSVCDEPWFYDQPVCLNVDCPSHEETSNGTA